MDLNSTDNILNQLSDMGEKDLNQVDLSISLVVKQKEADCYYQSMNIALDIEVKNWLKNHIVKFLNTLKEKDSLDNNVFNVGDYNLEIKKQDQIAKFDLNRNENLKLKKDQLISAISNPDPQFEEQNTNFQFVKVSYQSNKAYFCFYRGTKKNTKKRRYAIKNANQFQFFDSTVIDLGGNADFIIIEDYIFILNIKNFEYAFDFRDHINDLRDKNIAEIISMPFFSGEDSNKLEFEKACKTYIYSRSLANIQPDTIAALQQKFEDRCNELSEIKRKEPSDELAKEEYKKKHGTLWDLFDYIDIENYKIKFNPGEKPSPLIHFFSDKIAKSFLTESIKVVSSYEKN
ncbi:hypothetical protein C6W27_22945 [Bacillus paralicheniformis]|uniref:Kiwa anti-phage protein KwaB-like domain-containing protein n=1 Tax=Bacillus paralicheniformis TaxID=1648923 RepID=UPI000D03FAB1|nr:Kiwa anti-phage protein KwaB-like domain-containing protein [Bacillus paralicheniformis]PRS08069.1 hypothetical protein C6W27_22945 [Bacillus paralicheniformis]